MIVKIQFDRKWILQGSGLNSLAVGKAMNLCKTEYRDQVDTESISLVECVLKINTDESAEQVQGKLSRLITEKILKGSKEEGIFTLTIEGQQIGSKDDTSKVDQGSKDTPPASDQATPEPHPSETSKSATAAEEKLSALQRINALVGAAEFKSLCNEIHERAEYIRKNNTVSAFLSDSYLFSIPAGGGYSLSLSLLNELLVEEKLLCGESTMAEVSLPSPSDPEIQQKMANCFGAISHAFDSPRIISFDISPWVSHTGNLVFKDFLQNVMRKSGKSLVVFRTPYIGREQLKQTSKDINDLIFTRVVEFKPFSKEELRELATDMLNQFDFTMAESAWQVFDEKMVEEKQDGYFYGVHTVRKAINEIIHCTELYCARNGINTKTITDAAIAGLVPSKTVEGVSGMDMLDALVGMDSIKAQIMEIITQIIISRRETGPTMPCMHMRFVGNPGTGKTTVARIIGKILNERGVLRIGNFYEHRGRDLCGRYVGETAPKTTKICQEAYGSVLFLDEAYSLFRGNSDTVDYGREALDTLIAEMENNSEDLVVIFAGYPGDMDALMEGNAGLKSRMPYLITFPDYAREQLFEIFMIMVEKNFPYTEDLKDCAKEYFLKLPDAVIKQRKFGNARFVRNIYERTWGKAGTRCLSNNDEKITITGEDFKAAIEALQPDISTNDPVKPRIGF